MQSTRDQASDILRRFLTHTHMTPAELADRAKVQRATIDAMLEDPGIEVTAPVAYAIQQVTGIPARIWRRQR